MPAQLSALLGLAVAGCLLLAVAGLRRRPRPPTASRLPRLGQADKRRLAAAAVAAVGVQVLVGWPVAALLVGLGVLLLPPILGGRRAARRGEARIEAVGAWAEMLRDNLRSAAGLEQAILASAIAPPPAIEQEVRGLAEHLSRRVRLREALAWFAAAVGDPIADLVVGQLQLAATAQAGQLADALSDMAAMAREHVGIRLDVESERAGIRTQIRMIVATTLVLAVGLEIFRRPFLRPYATVTGQLVLLVIGAGGVAAFILLAKLSRFAEPPRVLTQPREARR
jgi:tight adherence protein B